MAEVAENNEVLENESPGEESPVNEAALDNSAENVAPESAAPEANESGESGSAPSDAEAAPQSSTATPDAEGFTSALPSLSADAEARAHVEGGVGYEIIYVVKAGDPQLVESSSQHVRDLIEKGEGAVDNVRASEVRRFAFPIKKQTEGVYVVVNARFKPEFTNELDRYFKIDENILRHMMLKEDR